MPSEFQGPFSEQKYEYPSAQVESTAGALTFQQRKIDPMGLLGKIFASLGAVLVVVGLLIAALLGLFFPSPGFGFFLAILAGAWGTGLIFVLVGLTFRLFFRNVRSAIVVDRYLMSLANQDYLAAFQYLDPGTIERQNEPDAQSWFIRRTQAYDDEQGRISNYTLRAFNLNPLSARYTIKLWRGAGPYTVRLFLLKQGDAWKIAGFDRF